MKHDKTKKHECLMAFMTGWRRGAKGCALGIDPMKFDPLNPVHRAMKKGYERGLADATKALERERKRLGVTPRELQLAVLR